MTAADPAQVLRHCPRCGAAALDWPRSHQLHCNACDFTLFLNAATAVAALIRDDAGRVLCAVRGRDPGRGLLDLPGGFVDPGESAEEALARELEEEIGVRPATARWLGSRPNTYPYGGLVYRTVDCFFAVTLPAGAQPRPADDVEGLVWRVPAELRPEEIAFASIRQALAAYA